MTCTFEPSGTKRLWKKHPHDVDRIRTIVCHALENEIATGFATSKRASHLTYLGHVLYECRVGLGKLPDVRVAYFVESHTATVVFISTTLQKSEFTHELEKML